MHKRSVLSILACLAFASAASARDTNQWLRLGDRVLDPGGDRAEIGLRGNEMIEALVLGVDNAAVRIYGVRVIFGNGQVLDWPIRGELYPRERTQVLDLPGRSERRVKKVVLFYETGRRRIEKDVERNRRWEQHRDWDREWNRDRDRQWDREWDRNWDRDYGRFQPVITVWGRD